MVDIKEKYVFLIQGRPVPVTPHAAANKAVWKTGFQSDQRSQNRFLEERTSLIIDQIQDCSVSHKKV